MTAARATITAVEPLAEHWLRLVRGRRRARVDLADVLHAGGVFAPIRVDRSLPAAVAVDPEFGAIVWPGEVDLDPDVLRGDRAPAPDRRFPAESFSLPERRRRSAWPAQAALRS